MLIMLRISFSLIPDIDEVIVIDVIFLFYENNKIKNNQNNNVKLSIIITTMMCSIFAIKNTKISFCKLR